MLMGMSSRGDRRAHGLTRLAVGLAVAASVVLVTRAVRATPSARLVYVRDKGAEDCPDEAALRAAVAARLGYDPFYPFAKATLFAEVGRDGGVIRARVRLVDEGSNVRGARDLEHKGTRCSDIVEGMALTMSIAIDPRSLAGPVTEPEPRAEEAKPRVEEAPKEAPPVEEPRAETAPAEAPDASAPKEPVHLEAHVLGAGWLGAAPGPSGGVLFGGELRYRAFAPVVEARFDAKASTDVNPGSVSTSFAGAVIAPCVALDVFRACPVLVIGRLAASASGIASPSDDAALHALGGVRAGVAIPLVGPLSLRAQVDALFAFTPQTIRIDAREVHALDRVSAGIGVGLGAAFF